MQPHWDGKNPGKMRAFAPPDKPTMPATARFPALPYFFALILGLLALVGYWYGLGQPVILPDAATPTHKLQCASYTPFDKDQSPFDQPFVPRAERMDADLALLATQPPARIHVRADA